MKKILVPLFSVLILLIIALAAMQFTDRDCERATQSVRAKFASFLEDPSTATDGVGVKWTPAGCTVTKDKSWWFVAPWGGVVAWKTFTPSETTPAEEEEAMEESSPSEEPMATWMSGGTIETRYFNLPVDAAYSVELEENRIRIQNFIGQDDPNYDYPDDAFFIEIQPLSSFGTDEATMLDGWQQDYDAVEDAILNTRTVRYGEGRHGGGDGWPGAGYFVPDIAVISLFAQTDSPIDPGLVLAKELISNIVWNETPWSIYQDPNSRFNFDYPPSMQNTQTQDPYYRLHNIVVTMTSAISDYQPMNYSQNEWFSVSWEAVEEKTCFANPDTGTAAFLERTTLNGIDFRVERSEDAGAGNRYEQKLYRTYRDNTCYEVATTLHYSSDWTDVDEAAMQRNQAKARLMLREMAGSFEFVR